MLTTTPWQPDPALSPGFQAKVGVLQTDGWILRGAYWRNHTLWNAGTTLREGREKLVVLPLDTQARSLYETELLLAYELVRAQIRCEGLRQEVHILPRLEPFLSSIRIHHGIEFTALNRRLAALS